LIETTTSSISLPEEFDALDPGPTGNIPKGGTVDIDQLNLSYPHHKKAFQVLKLWQAHNVAVDIARAFAALTGESVEVDLPELALNVTGITADAKRTYERIFGFKVVVTEVGAGTPQ
jgi:hypothetical protein